MGLPELLEKYPHMIPVIIHITYENKILKKLINKHVRISELTYMIGKGSNCYILYNNRLLTGSTRIIEAFGNPKEIPLISVYKENFFGNGL